MIRRGLLLVLTIGQFSLAICQPLYKDRTQPIEKRVQDLLHRMTPEEKFWQLFMLPDDLDNADTTQYKNGLFGFQLRGNFYQEAFLGKINAIQKYFVEKTRLGIPIIPFEEALHGFVKGDATVFPESIGLAATWDTILMDNVSKAIAIETKMRGIRQVLSPVINIASDVRWGRTEETYGEDPFLCSAMAVSFVRAFEKIGIITTPKHFIANLGDGGRDSYPIDIDERLLDEIYFPPFKACIQKGGSRSIMAAYNLLNGTACTSNSWLLQEKLKKQWGFNGFVISDANAVGGEVILHHTSNTYAESGQHAINNGLDVIFQTEYKHSQLFIPPFLDGGIDSNRINDAVARVLRAKFELGLFEYPYLAPPYDPGMKEQHRQLAKKAALESIVLLKNEKNVLPLSNQIHSIAVIGEDAEQARLGGYSGRGYNKINILDGIKDRTSSKIKVLYAPGCPRISNDYMVIPEKFLQHKDSAGLQAEYFNNVSLAGDPIVKRIDKKINFRWTLYGPDDAIGNEFYSARWTGDIISPETGAYKIGLEGNDGYRLFINDKIIIDDWQKQTYQTLVAGYSFQKGKKYNIRVEFFEPIGDATIKLIWNIGVINDWKKKIDEAVAITKKSDVAMVAVGLEEGEFRDRAMLSLPGHQEELINALAATGKPVIVVLVGGSAITMSNWIKNVKGVIDVWYPGEQGGTAIADVLFGDYNPAGRLPITFPLNEAQLPLVYNHKPTGRGDDYNNLSGLPLFPFGFGLSYTNFEYSNIRLDQKIMNQSAKTTVSFDLKNSGPKDGEEVVQLYIRDILSSVARPVMELKGFQRIHLKAGESQTISFPIEPEMLSMLNANMKEIVEPGEFSIMIGASSREIRIKEILTIK